MGFVTTPVSLDLMFHPLLLCADTRQAYVTNSKWDAKAQLPFVLSFFLVFAYLTLDLCILRTVLDRWPVAPNNAGNRLFQEELDAAIPGHFSDYRLNAPWNGLQQKVVNFRSWFGVRRNLAVTAPKPVRRLSGGSSTSSESIALPSPRPFHAGRRSVTAGGNSSAFAHANAMH